MSIQKVLIVDDSKTELMYMSNLLQKNGFAVKTAENADEAFRRLAEEKPDLILMDVNLPGMNGLQAMKRLRNTPETRLIPIIALTSNSTPQNIEAGLNAGFDGYLTKPIVVSELMKAIQKTLDNITDPI